MNFSTIPPMNPEVQKMVLEIKGFLSRIGDYIGQHDDNKAIDEVEKFKSFFRRNRLDCNKAKVKFRDGQILVNNKVLDGLEFIKEGLLYKRVLILASFLRNNPNINSELGRVLLRTLEIRKDERNHVLSEARKIAEKLTSGHSLRIHFEEFGTSIKFFTGKVLTNQDLIIYKDKTLNQWVDELKRVAAQYVASQAEYFKKPTAVPSQPPLANQEVTSQRTLNSQMHAGTIVVSSKEPQPLSEDEINDLIAQKYKEKSQFPFSSLDQLLGAMLADLNKIRAVRELNLGADELRQRLCTMGDSQVESNKPNDNKEITDGSHRPDKVITKLSCPLLDELGFEYEKEFPSTKTIAKRFTNGSISKETLMRLHDSFHHLNSDHFLEVEIIYSDGTKESRNLHPAECKNIVDQIREKGSSDFQLRPVH